jgi:hypothetical protein
LDNNFDYSFWGIRGMTSQRQPGDTTIEFPALQLGVSRDESNGLGRPDRPSATLPRT